MIRFNRWVTSMQIIKPWSAKLKWHWQNIAFISVVSFGAISGRIVANRWVLNLEQICGSNCQQLPHVGSWFWGHKADPTQMISAVWVVHNKPASQKYTLAVNHSELYRPKAVNSARSQCRDLRTGVMCSTFLVLVRTLATAFRIISAL